LLTAFIITRTLTPIDSSQPLAGHPAPVYRAVAHLRGLHRQLHLPPHGKLRHSHCCKFLSAFSAPRTRWVSQRSSSSSNSSNSRPMPDSFTFSSLHSSYNSGSLTPSNLIKKLYSSIDAHNGTFVSLASLEDLLSRCRWGKLPRLTYQYTLL